MSFMARVIVPRPTVATPGGIPLDIDVQTRSDVQLITLRGRLNLGEPFDQLSATMTELLNAGHSRFLLDLQDVPTVDSSGIGLLVRFLTSAKQRRGALKLLNPSEFVVQTLTLVRVFTLFEVFEDTQLALSSFH
jgi:anti-anti-sigma factor